MRFGDGLGWGSVSGTLGKEEVFPMRKGWLKHAVPKGWLKHEAIFSMRKGWLKRADHAPHPTND